MWMPRSPRDPSTVVPALPPRQPGICRQARAKNGPDSFRLQLGLLVSAFTTYTELAGWVFLVLLVSPS